MTGGSDGIPLSARLSFSFVFSYIGLKCGACISFLQIGNHTCVHEAASIQLAPRLGYIKVTLGHRRLHLSFSSTLDSHFSAELVSLSCVSDRHRSEI